MIDLLLAIVLMLVLVSSLVESIQGRTANLFGKRWERIESPIQFWAIILLEGGALVALIYVALRAFVELGAK